MFSRIRDRMRYALKFGYNGGGFSGWARQPGQRTVEGEVRNALKESLIVDDFSLGNPQVASRTDAGVSALGNALAITSEFKRDAILSALNAQLQDIWFYGMAAVSTDFNPRYATERWYRYHLMDCVFEPKSMEETAKIFEGSHDFSSFSRPKERNPQRTINSIQIFRQGGMVLIDIRAQSFLWNMARRIVKAILEVESQRITRDEIREALDSKRKIDLQVAPPEPLFLMDVTYDFEFEVDPARLLKLKNRLRENLMAAALNFRIYEHMTRIVSGK